MVVPTGNKAVGVLWKHNGAWFEKNSGSGKKFWKEAELLAPSSCKVVG